ITGELLSPDRVFDFSEDELEPHPAYDFFAPAPLPGYAGNPNNNGWLEADDYLFGELVAMVDEQMVVPAIKEMDALMMDMEEDLASLFGEDDDFKDDDSKGFDEEEGLLVPLFVIEDLSTRLGNLEYGHGQLVQRVNQVSDAEVSASVTIGELGLRIYTVKGQVQVMASQMVHAADR
nr:hypothetical protein [Tanacetum cinerariifolium]